MLFKLPIAYVDSPELHKLRESIVDDLELIENKNDYSYSETDQSEGIDYDNEKSVSMLTKIYKPESIIEKKYVKMHSQYTTSNIDHLECSQRIIKATNVSQNKKEERVKVFDDIHSTWENIRHDEEFLDKYYYIDIDYFKFLNQSPVFLQILSIYNLLSPVISFLLPVILLIIPFFIIKYHGIDMTISNYIKLVTDTLSKHPLGNIINIFNDVPTETKVYSVISVLFYFFSMYQNTMICYRFYKNFEYIHKVLESIKCYLKVTMDNIIEFHETISNDDCPSDSYKLFDKDMMEMYGRCQELHIEMEKIEPFSFSTFSKIKNKTYDIGRIMKLFHDVHLNYTIMELLEYTFQFNCFLENIRSLSRQLNEEIINTCKLGEDLLFMKDMGHPIGKDEERDDIITNKIDLNKNMIITGPNASGKTTILKGILLNVILSHQHGIGYYQSGTKMPMYSEIHCYLNIPDTSGRDSLFQAEARRCKEILDKIEESEENESIRHFCIFDELFSGTNPDEAISSSYGFINYLINTKRIDFALTTHLGSLCDMVEKNKMKRIKNMKMETNEFKSEISCTSETEEKSAEEAVDFHYTYKLEKGISKVKGGLKVLKDLKYPASILRLF
jgi:energy-coupling factor transporter ATP-binding protein EcfA2